MVALRSLCEEGGATASAPTVPVAVAGRRWNAFASAPERVRPDERVLVVVHHVSDIDGKAERASFAHAFPPVPHYFTICQGR